MTVARTSESEPQSAITGSAATAARPNASALGASIEPGTPKSLTVSATICGPRGAAHAKRPASSAKPPAASQTVA